MRAVLEGEAIPVVPISEVMGIRAKVFAILPEVSRDIDAAREPSNAPDAVKVVGEVEAPGREGSPMQAVGES